jgi:iron complex transport system substrate-binding protein
MRKCLSIFIILALCAGCAEQERKAALRDGIISMSPNLTETIYALGQGDRLIARGAFDDFPPEALELPDAGGYLDPNLEKILQLAPELIVLPGQHPKVSEFARLNSIPVLNVHMDNLATIDQGIATLGEALRCEEEADVLRARLNAEVAALREAVAPLTRPKVFIVTTRQNNDLNTLNTSGGTSFVSEIVDLAGGENIYQDAQQPYLEASKETLVMRAPEVILEFQAGAELSEAQRADLTDDWNQLPALPAVRDRRIYVLTGSHTLRPGPRITEVAWEIARLLHPDLRDE